MHKTQAHNHWTLQQEPNPSAARRRLHSWAHYVSGPMNEHILGVIFTDFWVEYDSIDLEYVFPFVLWKYRQYFSL